MPNRSPAKEILTRDDPQPDDLGACWDDEGLPWDCGTVTGLWSCADRGVAGLSWWDMVDGYGPVSRYADAMHRPAAAPVLARAPRCTCGDLLVMHREGGEARGECREPGCACVSYGEVARELVTG